MPKVSINPQFLVDEKGKTKSVLLSVSDYDKLIQHLEDLKDTLILDESVRTAKGFRNYAEIQAELKKSGRL